MQATPHEGPANRAFFRTLRRPTSSALLHRSIGCPDPIPLAGRVLVQDTIRYFYGETHRTRVFAVYPSLESCRPRGQQPEGRCLSLAC